MTKVYIDGDILVYRAALKCETICDWGDDLWSIAADLREAKGHFTSEVSRIITILSGEFSSIETIVCVSCQGPTFRHVLFPDYKGNRKSRKPLVFRPLRDWAVTEMGAIRYPRLEADDVMGIGATKNPDSVIVTIDKDLRSIPGKHYNPDKPEEGVVDVSLSQADEFFFTQSIAGDPTDNFKGVPGIGMVRAAKLLDKEGASWETVLGAYAKAKLSEEEALLNTRMARILRHTDWDSKKSEAILWNPK